MKQTAVRLPDEMKSEATKKGRKDERTFSGYVRFLIARDLGWTAEQFEKAERELEASGKRDLGTASGKVKSALKKKK